MIKTQSISSWYLWPNDKQPNRIQLANISELVLVDKQNILYWFENILKYWYGILQKWISKCRNFDINPNIGLEWYYWSDDYSEDILMIDIQTYPI